MKHSKTSSTDANNTAPQGLRSVGRSSGYGYVVGIGGIGGDSHCVGLQLLRQRLVQDGYSVKFLGIQNQPDDFVELADACNIIMMSSLDGHATKYLRNFEVPKQHRANTLWYVGGNLTMSEEGQTDAFFLDKGFNRAFLQHVDLKEVMQTLRDDLAGIEPKSQESCYEDLSPRSQAKLGEYGKLSDALLWETRERVLGHWPTGRAARDLDRNAECLRQAPSMPEALHTQGEIICQMRSGVGDVKGQHHLFSEFSKGGAGIVSYQVDSLTRNNNYTLAEEEMVERKLNGFPAVNAGVAALQSINQASSVPVQIRHSCLDPRLLAEVSYASGITGFEGGAICYNVPYYKDYPLAQSINRWKYVDRLTAYYFDEYGVRLDREFFGALTATLLPPCIPIVVNILESLLAAGQGVRSVSLGYAEQGNRHQDIAAIKCLKSLTEEYLDRFYPNHQIDCSTVFYQYMAAFPSSEARSRELIQESATTAALSGTRRVILKSVVESSEIPSADENLAAFNVALSGINNADANLISEALVNYEVEQINAEVRDIMESLLAQDEALEACILKAFATGLMDIPFSPSVHVKSSVKAFRDNHGAVRIMDFGGLALSERSREIHQQKLALRLGNQRVGSPNFTQILEEDVLKIPRGNYAAWPLDQQHHVMSAASNVR